jgi:regulator of protease activity HflC (stomatin/prohibitin superfamily)
MFRSVRSLVMLAALALSAAACTRVDPGNVGIRVSSFGGGVQTEVVPQGSYKWTGPGFTMYEYPVFKQTVTWSKANNDPVTFQTGDSMSVGADVGMTYHVGQQCVSKFFSEYRVDIDKVTNTFILNNVRSAFNNYAANIKDAAELIPEKQALLAHVKSQVRKDLEPNCLYVDDVYLVGEFDLPATIRGAINAKIQATQMAAQRQNEVAQAQAEAQKAVVTAKGEADARVLAAQAEAESIKIKGAALRENQNLVDLTLAERWDGHYPATLITGGERGQILQIPTTAGR